MDKWIMCVVALILGMLLANMLKNVCGCKTVEGARELRGERNRPAGEACQYNENCIPGLTCCKSDEDYLHLIGWKSPGVGECKDKCNLIQHANNNGL